MLEARNRRHVERHRRSRRDPDFDELTPESPCWRRNCAASISGLGIPPFRLLGCADETRRPALSFCHQPRQRPPVRGAELDQHRGCGTQLAPFESRQGGPADAGAVSKRLERPSPLTAQPGESSRDSALGIGLVGVRRLCGRWRVWGRLRRRHVRMHGFSIWRVYLHIENPVKSTWSLTCLDRYRARGPRRG